MLSLDMARTHASLRVRVRVRVRRGSSPLTRRPPAPPPPAAATRTNSAPGRGQGSAAAAPLRPPTPRRPRAPPARPTHGPGRGPGGCGELPCPCDTDPTAPLPRLGSCGRRPVPATGQGPALSARPGVGRREAGGPDFVTARQPRDGESSTPAGTERIPCRRETGGSAPPRSVLRELADRWRISSSSRQRQRDIERGSVHANTR